MITESVIQQLLAHNAIGNFKQLIALKGGTQNKNYKLSTDQGDFVITDYKRHDKNVLPDILAIVNTLQQNNFPAPKIFQNDKQQLLQHYDKHFLVLSEFIKGEHAKPLNEQQAFSVGNYLARFHHLTQSISWQRNSIRDHSWIIATSDKLLPKLSPADRELLQSELSFQQQQCYEGLPRGLIHSDLFCDNILFSGNTLTGMIDFYDVCKDYLLLDIGIAIMGCCRSLDNEIDDNLAEHFLAGYQQQRPLTPAEQQSFTAMQRLGVLGFWLTRLHHFYFGSPTYAPEQLSNILKQLRRNAC